MHYLNEGVMAHPMHLHGLVQLVTAKDGFPLPQPYEADTVMVAPGERFTVLVQANKPGLWRSTATSSRTPNARTACSACSAWSPP